MFRVSGVWEGQEGPSLRFEGFLRGFFFWAGGGGGGFLSSGDRVRGLGGFRVQGLGFRV